MADSTGTDPGHPLLLPAASQKCYSKMLTMVFATCGAGDTFLVGVFSNPPMERAGTVPSGIAIGMTTIGNVLES